MIEWHGERAATNLMRKHFGWYLRGFEGASSYRQSLVMASNRDEMFSILNSIV
jgi:tRNA-dihydrouridine synthase B